ncbi:HNH endonuclease [Nonomuraea roseoviolacea]|uniref:HNH endonuclease n=1 Tax=Nonomuraea roseoviolacea TaxID=103837 RepID=UPI003B5C67C8
MTSKRNLSRPSDWNRRRRAVPKRDIAVCYLCRLPGATEVDHVTAVADGGGWEYANLRSAHRACHADKTLRERASRGRRTNQSGLVSSLVVVDGQEGCVSVSTLPTSKSPY